MPLSYNPYDPAIQGLQGAVLPGTGFQQSQVQGRFTNPQDPNATVYPPDQGAALAALQDQRKTELQRNIASGGAGPLGNVNLQDLNSDIQKNPLTQQNQDSAQINAANFAAMLQGYRGGPVRQVAAAGDQGPGSSAEYESGITDSPGQQMAKAQRAAELAKSMNAPGGPATEQIKESGAMNIEKMKEDAATKRNLDFLNSIKNMNLQPGGEIDLPGGGGKLRQNAVNPPAGPQGVQVENDIQTLMGMQAPNATAGTGISQFFGNLTGGRMGQTLKTQQAVLEGKLDIEFPQWRQRVMAQNPGFRFATGASARQPPQAPGVPGGQPNVAPTSRQTRPLKSGGIAYSDDNGKTWFTNN